MLLAGCQNSADNLVFVAGHITLDGQPLPRGSVSLRPLVEGTNWEHPTGLISEGRFEVFTRGQRGAPPGEYRVVVFATEEATMNGAHPGMPRSLIPPRYNDPQQTPIRWQVKPQSPPDAFNLELVSHER